MYASDSFMEFLYEQLAPLGRISPRRMFGSIGLFCEGVMFGLAGEDVLYFRVDEGNKILFQEAKDEPLSYEKKGKVIELAFWRVPERLFDEPDELVIWARAALQAAHRVAAVRPVKKRAPKRAAAR